MWFLNVIGIEICMVLCLTFAERFFNAVKYLTSRERWGCGKRKKSNSKLTENTE